MKILITLMLSLFVGLTAGAQQLQPTKAIPVQQQLVFAAASIANGQTVSAAITSNGMALVGVQLPAAFTGTTLTFQVSLDCSVYQAVYVTTSGTALSYTVAQGRYIAIDPAPFQGAKCIKLISGSSEAAGRSFTVALKGF